MRPCIFLGWLFFFVLLRSLVFFCVLLLLSFLLFLWIDTIAIEPYGSCCLVAVSLFFLHLIRFSLTVRTVKCATTKQRQNKYLAWILVGSTFYSWPKVNPVVDTANFMNRNVKCDQEGSTVCKTIRKRKLKEEHSYCYFCFGFVACVSPSTKLQMRARIFHCLCCLWICDCFLACIIPFISTLCIHIFFLFGSSALFFSSCSSHICITFTRLFVIFVAKCFFRAYSLLLLFCLVLLDIYIEQQQKNKIKKFNFCGALLFNWLFIFAA